MTLEEFGNMMACSVVVAVFITALTIALSLVFHKSGMPTVSRHLPWRRRR